MQVKKVESFVLTLTREELTVLKNAVNWNYPEKDKENEMAAALFDAIVEALALRS